MLRVGSMLIRCICKKCEHENDAWLSSSNIYETIECPQCGERTFSKKMISLKIKEVAFRKIQSYDIRKKSRELRK